MKKSQTTVGLRQHSRKRPNSRFLRSKQNSSPWRRKNSKSKAQKWKPRSNYGPSRRSSVASKTEWTAWKRSSAAIRSRPSGRALVPKNAFGWRGKRKLEIRKQKAESRSRKQKQKAEAESRKQKAESRK